MRPIQYGRASLVACLTDLSVGYRWQWRASANADIGAMLDSAVKAIDQVAAVIAIVA
jgi:hypothetical protein